MGLYLTVFDDNDEELDGVEIGSYLDYDLFIQNVINDVEGGVQGTACPALTLHHDSEGEWNSEEAVKLRTELQKITEVFKSNPPVKHNSAWVAEVMSNVGLKPTNAYESFIDVDGEFLIDRLIGLAELSIKTGFPILFQ
jgi:Immunity protein 70